VVSGITAQLNFFFEVQNIWRPFREIHAISEKNVVFNTMNASTRTTSSS